MGETGNNGFRKCGLFTAEYYTEENASSKFHLWDKTTLLHLYNMHVLLIVVSQSQTDKTLKTYTGNFTTKCYMP